MKLNKTNKTTFLHLCSNITTQRIVFLISLLIKRREDSIISLSQCILLTWERLSIFFYGKEVVEGIDDVIITIINVTKKKRKWNYIYHHYSSKTENIGKDLLYSM